MYGNLNTSATCANLKSNELRENVFKHSSNVFVFGRRYQHGIVVPLTQFWRAFPHGNFYAGEIRWTCWMAGDRCMFTVGVGRGCSSVLGRSTVNDSLGGM